MKLVMIGFALLGGSANAQVTTFQYCESISNTTSPNQYRVGFDNKTYGLIGADLGVYVMVTSKGQNRCSYTSARPALWNDGSDKLAYQIQKVTEDGTIGYSDNGYLGMVVEKSGSANMYFGLLAVSAVGTNLGKLQCKQVDITTLRKQLSMCAHFPVGDINP